jgi:hypothetical protein
MENSEYRGKPFMKATPRHNKMALEITKESLIIRDCGMIQSANIINKLQLIKMVEKFHCWLEKVAFLHL